MAANIPWLQPQQYKMRTKLSHAIVMPVTVIHIMLIGILFRCLSIDVILELIENYFILLSLSTGGRRGGKLVQITEKKDFNANRGEEPHTKCLQPVFWFTSIKKLSQHTKKWLFANVLLLYIFFWLYLKCFLFFAEDRDGEELKKCTHASRQVDDEKCSELSKKWI